MFARLNIPIFAIIAFALSACTGSFTQHKYYDPTKAHHTKTGFKNPPGSAERPFRPFRFINFISKRLMANKKNITLPEGHIVPPAEALQQFAAAPNNARITWIGHAGFLIGLNGINILTDPHFTERASPISFAGPKRYIPPGLAIKDLPKIDVIIISHDHYDALDEGSIRQLMAHSPEALFILPLGDGELVREWGGKNIKEVDWYDKVKVGEVTFQSTPAIHRSNRGLFDKNDSLWHGMTIAGTVGGKPKKIWFIGDTGFGPVFKSEVAKKIGSVDIALIPNGAFLPRNIMRAVHASPAEGLELAALVGAKTAIPMHWGYFPLGEDTPEQGKAYFMAAPDFGIKKVLMGIGETRDLNGL